MTSTSAKTYTTADFLHAAFGCTAVVEMRAKEDNGTPKGQIWSGYYDNLDTMAAHAASITEDEPMQTVWFTLNRLRPDIIENCRNHYEHARVTTRHIDTVQRGFILIDCDSAHPKDVMANDAEKAAAVALSEKVLAYLTSKNWPDPIRTDSGNGVHLLFKVQTGIKCDTPKATEPVALCLAALDSMFSVKDGPHVDTIVFDGSRVCGLPGTWNRKGKNTPERPWRMRQVLSIPAGMLKDPAIHSDSALRVTPAQIEALAALAPPGTKKVYRATAQSDSVDRKAVTQAMKNFLRQNEEYLPDVLGHRMKGDQLYIDLDGCPFKRGGGAHNGSSDKTSLIVGDWLGFSCFSDHEGSGKKTFEDLENLLDEEYGIFREAVMEAWDQIDYFGTGWVYSAPVEVADIPELEETITAKPVLLTTQEMMKILGGEYITPVPAVGVEEPVAPTTASTVPPTALGPAPVAPVTPTVKTSALVQDDPNPAPDKPAPAPRPYTAPVQAGGTFALDMPPEAMYGWLGKKASDIQSPLSWAYPAILTVAASLMEPKFNNRQARPTLYTALLGKIDSGKTVVMDRASRVLGIGDDQMVTEVPCSDHGLLGMFKQPTGPEAKENFLWQQPQLLLQDELVNMMNKGQIQGSTLIPTLCTLWSKDHAGASVKGKNSKIEVQLSILGGLALADGMDFQKVFGAATNGGLYDRFLFGPGPDDWKFDRRWENFDCAKTEHRNPKKVQIPFPDYVYGDVEAWGDTPSPSGNPRMRRRLTELAIRIAYITAAYNHDEVITRECVTAALNFMTWQEKVRMEYSTGVAENLDGFIAESILRGFDNPKGAGRFLNFRQVANLSQNRWISKWGSAATRALDTLVKSGDLVQMIDISDGEMKRTNCYCLHKHAAAAEALLAEAIMKAKKEAA